MLLVSMVRLPGPRPAPMTLPPVVSDPESRCPERMPAAPKYEGQVPDDLFHVWEWVDAPGIEPDYQVCRYCGGRGA